MSIYFLQSDSRFHIIAALMAAVGRSINLICSAIIGTKVIVNAGGFRRGAARKSNGAIKFDLCPVLRHIHFVAHICSVKRSLAL